ncbi:bifunctional peptidase and arginyl-hydroxylase JMJD5 [Galleria mellonella]|uniref:Bifunctional peptidase and arginyl-hydroxylase JMJD5 n=1 Tax=Galleria mellonella TaxID=7137 RepID=A0A6J3CCP0_GALME|nr:bifunctional peptidase and arginyl-hydroxylase JMJD5 [Galleria mellonella]
MQTCEEIYYKLESFKDSVKESLSEIEELDVTCKTNLQNYLNNMNSKNPTAIIKIQAIIDYMYERVNIGNWKEVKLFLRKTITIASYLKLVYHVKQADMLDDLFIKESYKIIDFGILFGCPLDREPKLLQNCASCFNDVSQPSFYNVCNDKCMVDSVQESIDFEHNKYSTHHLDVLDCPSMEHFYRNYILKEQPVILNNCINHWPALSKWKDINYLKKVAGSRTVPIELGRVYTDTDWTQKLMTVDEFISKHIYQCDSSTGYLAQYQLFEHIPELKKDISEPEYCCFSDDEEAIDIMAWFGPKGTISALHHDPKRNLLTQVIGEKRLFLFSPSDSDFLYPHEHELLNNTAQVDPREPDLEKYPKYKNATPFYCVLHPGQMLYIPPKWWHFVESLSISISVSFWWS